jgi:hypothetical protein
MAARISTKAFRDFLPKIREMIYVYSFWQPDYSGGKEKTPVLLAALRGKSELYTEALHSYYANTTVEFMQCNFQRFEALNPASWGSIFTLSIYLP